MQNRSKGVPIYTVRILNGGRTARELNPMGDRPPEENTPRSRDWKNYDRHLRSFVIEGSDIYEPNTIHRGVESDLDTISFIGEVKVLPQYKESILKDDTDLLSTSLPPE